MNQPGNQRLYAIGDIHGHFQALQRMEAALLHDGMDPDRDLLVFLGDYIDRGPDSSAVVEWMMARLAQFPHWVALMGNHEQMMLHALQRGAHNPEEFDLWWYQGGRETFESYGKPLRSFGDPHQALVEAIPPDHVAWISRLSTMHETDRCIFVHGGLRPGRPASESTDQDRLWIREPFLYSSYDWGKVVIHGHTPIEAPDVRPNRIGIDTILRTGRLTAVELSGNTPRFLQSG